MFNKTYDFINIFNLTNDICWRIDNIIQTVHKNRETFL